MRDECDLSDDALKHDPVRGAGNGMGWLLTETLDTLVPRSPLTNLLRELHRCMLPEWATFLLFFCPPTSHAWHDSMPSFLWQGDEIEMQLLWREVPRLWTHQEWRAMGEQYPPGMISATPHFKKWTYHPPGAHHTEITNDNTQCTKCINIYLKFVTLITQLWLTKIKPEGILQPGCLTNSTHCQDKNIQN